MEGLLDCLNPLPNPLAPSGYLWPGKCVSANLLGLPPFSISSIVPFWVMRNEAQSFHFSASPGAMAWLLDAYFSKSHERHRQIAVLFAAMVSVLDLDTREDTVTG